MPQQLREIARSRVGGVLPAPRTPLVGRREQVRAVLDALTVARLVTLTGPGGAGKTRLALAVAADAGEFAPDGVVWVELAGLGSADLVGEAVAAALRVPELPGRTPAEAAAEHIEGGAVLLALDNCEHLAAACAELVDTLLDRCPALRVLATSREPLAVEGETIWPVPPLSLPPAVPASPDAIAGCAAGQLFEQRARAVLPEFRLTPQNAPTVARVCRHVSGLPLAIELAAARVRVLSVEQIGAGLSDVFRLLVGGARTAPPRQQTLRATLDWSYDLLTEPERVVFRRLSVFPGAFSLAAAERVAAVPARDADVFDVLTRLVDRSLVTVQRSGGAVRYRLLAPIRAYGRERLAAAGEDEMVGRAHLEYFAEVVEAAEPRLTGPDQARELDRLEAEGNNLRVALAFARDCGEPVAGMRLATGLWRLCVLRGHYREGREWLDWAAAVEPEGPAPLRAKALRGSGTLAFLQCDYAGAIDRLEAGLALYRDLDDASGTASTLQVLGSIAREQGRYERAESLHAESRALFEAVGDRLGVARTYGYLGFAACLQEHWSSAIEQCDRALAEFRELGDGDGTAWSLLTLGIVAQYQGDYERAGALLSEAQAFSRKVGYPEGVAWSLHELGLLALRRGDPDAQQLLLDSLAGHRILGDQWRTASVLDDIATCVLAGGEPERAAALLGAAAGIRDRIGTTIAPCERPAVAAPRAADAPARDARQPVRVVPVRIRALGAATVDCGGRLLTPADWGYGKPRELLFLLAASAPQTKEQLGVALWPQLSGSQLRNALHTALRDLRRALGDPAWVRFSAGRYTLDRSREHWLDLEVFEGELAAARRARPAAMALPHLQRAIAAYGGDLLPDFVDSEWTQSQRKELRRAFTAALSGAGRILAAEGHYRQAEEIYRKAVAHEPLDEAAHRQLMSCLARAGEPGQAARHYEQLTERLRDDLGVAPAAETTAVYQRVRRAR
jgi:predicted ATPase/DNA-binding SARP family transcriptional activator